MSNWELNRELKEIDKEREVFTQELTNKRQHMANLLLNDMGKDIDDVLKGKVKVKLIIKHLNCLLCDLLLSLYHAKAIKSIAFL